MIETKFVNYYLLLNVSPQAKTEEIKKAYLKLVHTYHPDKNKGHRLSEKKFQQINSAWEVLKNPKKKSLFDLSLKKHEELKKLKNSFVAIKTTEKKIDLEYPLWVSIEDICQSRVKVIQYLKLVKGSKQKDFFEFPIPRGAKDGTRLWFKGQGGAEGDKQFGDMYIKISIRPHKVFKVLENSMDIILRHPISFIDSLTSKNLNTLSPYGCLSLNVQPPLRHNQILKIKDQGLIKNQTGDKGDLFVKIFIDYPLDRGVNIKKDMRRLSYEDQKIYVENFKDSQFVYPEVLKFQKNLQALKRKYYS